MKTPVTRHEPSSVVPDLVPQKHDATTAKSGVNIRLSPVSSVKAQAITRRPGNAEIPNPLLPADGVNFTVGQTIKSSTGQQFKANYNSTGNHAIYRLTEPGVWETVIQGSFLGFKQPVDPSGPDYVENYFVSLLYHNPTGLLLFEDGIIEDRVVDVEKAIAGFYGSNPPAWMLAQLHRPPAFRPQLFGITAIPETQFDYISGTYPKPIEDISDRGYQFGYNYGYAGKIESKISEASAVNWNNGPYLIVPDEEFYPFIGNGTFPGGAPTAPNPYIEYVKFYYRLGNTNEWQLLRKVENKVANWLSGLVTTPSIPAGYHFGILLPQMNELTPTSGVSAAALNSIDAIGRKSRGTRPGTNRLVKWYPTFGYNASLPTAGITPVQETEITQDSTARTFAPVVTNQDFGLLCDDNRGRIIGSKFIGTRKLNVPASYDVNIQDIRTADPGFDFENATWQDVVDFLPSPPGGVLRSQHDLYRLRYDFTPDGVLDENIETVRLISRNHFQLSNIQRTQSRPFFIFKEGGENGLLKAFLDTAQGYNVVIDDIPYTFYGIGFEMGSGNPINFSTEQNYYITLRGYVHSVQTTGFSEVPVQLLTSGIEYKVTDQLGTILVCKLPEPNVLDQRTSFSVLNYADQGTPGPWIHCLADIILYSKVASPSNLYNTNTDVSWTRAEWLNQVVKSYYGDSYLTTDQKTYFATSRSVYSGIPTSGDITLQFYSLAKIEWLGTFASMAMSGIFVEFWDSDIGVSTALQPEPFEQTLTKGMIHGEQYLPNTQINNMFVFPPGNQAQVTGDIGEITQLAILATGSGDGDNIYCICTNGTEIRLLGKVQQTGTNGFGPVVLSTEVFGSENTQDLRYGAQSQKEIVTTDDGHIFYFDRIKKVFTQISRGGQDAISIQKGFQSDMDLMTEPGCMGYDPSTGEVVYASGLTGFSYNFRTKQYQGLRTFGISNLTEMFGFGSSKEFPKQLYSYSKGKAYRCNTPDRNQTWNGEPYQMSVTVVSCPAVAELKNYASVRYHSLAGKVFFARVVNQLGRVSNISLEEFEEYIGYFKGAILRDENSAGGKYEGDYINGAWAEATLMDVDDTPKDITFIEVGYTPALGQ